MQISGHLCSDYHPISCFVFIYEVSPNSLDSCTPNTPSTPISATGLIKVN